MKIIVVGGGWAGCAAACSARKAGAEVILMERTDMLLGTGLVGGIMRNNGRFTATEELIAMGGGTLLKIIDTNLRHKNIAFPGHKHASLYDISKMPGLILDYLTHIGVVIRFQTRIKKVTLESNTITLVEDDNKQTYHADTYIDCTGSAGPQNNCSTYGNGCAMCAIRCPSFGGRISLVGAANIKESKCPRDKDQYGSMSGSCKLHKDSLSPDIQQQLEEEGVVIIPVPPALREDHLSIKSCQQYALPAFADNIILLDTGHAKLMTPYYPLDKLRKIPGLKYARYEDPYAGGKGNSIRFLAMSPTNRALKVTGLDNVFCAGEKVGPIVGHTEAVITGTLAGHNAVLYCQDEAPLILSENTAIGDALAYINEEVKTEEGLKSKYTFSGSKLFEHMKIRDLYTTDITIIAKRVSDAGLTDIFE